MKNVVILQHRLMHYRVQFFDQLKENSRKVGINISLVHGQASPRDKLRKDEGVLPWACKVKNRYLRIDKKDLLWQPLPVVHRNPDLLIVMQENRILSNYSLILNSILFGNGKVAYWGHGKNFQSNTKENIKEIWKRQWLKSVDWWFTYTKMSAEVISSAGFDDSRITVIENTIDTNEFSTQLHSIGPMEVEQELSELNIPKDNRIALFCGSIYPDKKPIFLLKSAEIIKKRFSNFHLLVVGSGPDDSIVKRSSKNHNWIHYLGNQKGKKKALYFRMSDIILNPGAVGLGVIDAFCSGLPLLTVDGSRHGPEICYLKDGENGLITDGNVEDYAEAAISLFQNKNRYNTICKNALADSKRYTVENMADRFIQGISNCLSIQKKNIK